jgi:hypothetical protein
MSLMRWLAACSSLKSVEDRPSPYRMRQHSLPKFGQKNVKDHVGKPHVRFAKRIWCWVREWIFEPWRPIARGVAQRCRPSRLFRRTKPRPKAVVQAELLLDTVRVVRNDLTEEDFVRTGQESFFAKPQASPNRMWGRITSRIFRPGQGVR